MTNDSVYHIDSDGHILNVDGWIFLRYFQPTQKYVKVGVNEYVFVPKNNVAGAWVRPEDVDAIFAMRRQCCGGHYNQAFFYVNETNTRLWLGMER